MSSSREISNYIERIAQVKFTLEKCISKLENFINKDILVKNKQIIETYTTGSLNDAFSLIDNLFETIKSNLYRNSNPNLSEEQILTHMELKEKMIDKFLEKIEDQTNELEKLRKENRYMLISLKKMTLRYMNLKKRSMNESMQDSQMEIDTSMRRINNSKSRRSQVHKKILSQEFNSEQAAEKYDKFRKKYNLDRKDPVKTFKKIPIQSIKRDLDNGIKASSDKKPIPKIITKSGYKVVTSVLEDSKTNDQLDGGNSKRFTHTKPTKSEFIKYIKTEPSKPANKNPKNTNERQSFHSNKKQSTTTAKTTKVNAIPILDSKKRFSNINSTNNHKRLVPAPSQNVNDSRMSLISNSNTINSNKRNSVILVDRAPCLGADIKPSVDSRRKSYDFFGIQTTTEQPKVIDLANYVKEEPKQQSIFKSPQKLREISENRKMVEKSPSREEERRGSFASKYKNLISSLCTLNKAFENKNKSNVTDEEEEK